MDTDYQALCIELMNRQCPCTAIDVDFLHKQVQVWNYTDGILNRA